MTPDITTSGARQEVPIDLGEIKTEVGVTRLRRELAFGAALVAAPLAVGLGVARLLDSRRAGIVAGTVTAAGIAAVRWQLQRWFTAQPAYSVERRIGRVEIRRYRPRVEAQTTLAEPSLESALDQGFRRLARFICGSNHRSETLSMTTPVIGAKVGSERTIAFVMPADRTAESLPRPTGEGIQLVDVPTRRIAVLAFRGGRRDRLIERRIVELRGRLASAGLTPTGEPMYAGYDPPWTLPALRRNEIWIEVA